MNTREALALFRGDGGPAPLMIRDPRTAAHFAEQANAREAAIVAKQNAPRRSLPHATAALSRVDAALGQVDPRAAFIAKYDLFRVVSAGANAHPNDPGVRKMALLLRKAWDLDPMGSFTVGQMTTLRQKAAELGGARSAIHALLEGPAMSASYVNIDTKKLAQLAEGVRDQDSFDAVCHRAGLVGERPDQVKARRYLLAICQRRADGDPMSVEVIEQQPAAMEGPKAGDGGAALSADSMGSGRDAGWHAQVEAALLRGETIAKAGFQIHVDPDTAHVVLRTASGSERRAPLSGLVAVIRDFGHLTADEYEPKINEQQPPWVDINQDEAGDVLGKDSETNESATRSLDAPGKIKQEHPASDQAGTSSSVQGARVLAFYRCEADHCGHALVAPMPRVGSEVAQPDVWRLAARRLGSAPRYPEVLAAYKDDCAKLGLVPGRRASVEKHICPRCYQASLVRSAGAAETLGKDHQQDESAWMNPGEILQHNSKPDRQPGTALSPKSEATEPDHQQDSSPWMDPGEIITSREGPKKGQLDNLGDGKAKPFGKEEQIENLGDDKAENFDEGDGGRAANIENFGDNKAEPFTEKDAEEARRKKDMKGGWAGQKPKKDAGLELTDVRPTDPAARYRQAMATRPTDRLLAGIGDERGWIARRAAEAIVEASSRRTDLRQVGMTALGPTDGTITASFRFDAARGAPSAADVSAFVAATHPGLYRVAGLTVQAGIAHVLFEGTGDPAREIDQKRAAIRAALRGAQAGQDPAGMGSDYAGPPLNQEGQMEVPGIPEAGGDEAGGEHNAAKCGQCAGMGQCAGAACKGCGGSGMAPPPPAPGAGVMAEKAALAATSAKLAARGHAVSPAALRAWLTASGVAFETPKRTARAFAAAHGLSWGGEPGRTAARISEGWGEGGAFERAVEADSAEELWKLHRGLNGGPEPSWPAPPVPQPPVAPPPEAKGGAQKAGPSPKPAPGGAAPAGGSGGPPVPPEDVPQPPVERGDGQPGMPEAEPEPVAADKRKPIPPSFEPAEARAAARRW